jgi:iron(III) transport system permease protein
MLNKLQSIVRRRPEIVLICGGCFVFLLIVLGPFLYLVVRTSIVFITQSQNWFVLALPSGRRLLLLCNSLMFAFSVSLGGTLIGTFGGFALLRWHTPIGIYLRLVVLLLILIPPYIHALAWMSVVSAINTILPPSLYLYFGTGIGWLVAWWVNVMALLPISLGMALLGFATIDNRLIEAAQLQRPETDIFLKIALPLATPMILAGAGFLFLLSLIDYTIPSLFQVTVYAMEIYATYSASSDPLSTFILALPLLIITMVVMYFSQARLRNIALNPSKHRKPWVMTFKNPRWLLWGQRCSLLFVGLQVLVPLCSLIFMVGDIGQFTQVVHSSKREILFTFGVCVLSTLVTLPLALAAAKVLVRGGITARIWWLIVTIPLALPAPLVGIALIALCNRMLPVDIYNSAVMPVLAAITRFAPLAAIVLSAQLQRIDSVRLDAARIYQVNPLSSWIYILLPMLTPGLLAAACITFALTAGELGATLLVVPAGEATLTMRIYSYLHYGASESIAALCLIMTLFTMVMAGITAYILHCWQRPLANNSYGK